MLDVEHAGRLPEALLAECPFCGNSLDGFPVRDNCPKCWRQFDRRWRIFGGQLGWNHWSPTQRILCIVAFTVVSLFGLLDLLRNTWNWSSVHSWASLVCAVLGPIVLIKARRSSVRSSRSVIVGPDLVAVARSRKPEVESCSLDTIEHARAGSNEWLILTIAGQERKLCRFPNGRHEAQGCADYINQQLAHRHPAEALRSA